MFVTDATPMDAGRGRPRRRPCLPVSPSPPPYLPLAAACNNFELLPNTVRGGETSGVGGGWGIVVPGLGAAPPTADWQNPHECCSHCLSTPGCVSFTVKLLDQSDPYRSGDDYNRAGECVLSNTHYEKTATAGQAWGFDSGGCRTPRPPPQPPPPPPPPSPPPPRRRRARRPRRRRPARRPPAAAAVAAAAQPGRPRHRRRRRRRPAHHRRRRPARHPRRPRPPPPPPLPLAAAQPPRHLRRHRHHRRARRRRTAAVAPAAQPAAVTPATQPAAAVAAALAAAVAAAPRRRPARRRACPRTRPSATSGSST